MTAARAGRNWGADALLRLQMREDLERLKKIRLHRGLRTYWGLRVRGQHTKTTGRRGSAFRLLLLVSVSDADASFRRDRRCYEEGGLPWERCVGGWASY